ncbi:hypothetical protein BD626DRAFT_569155 [Schizophyllum amplum]|uniref:SLC26A/SulP transporter domain-containing protein n=1 Tax=Schizophyllum amplum TaxID=97359 RepID=A0A550CE81_9AGAR|nr:hypothetical protein BD626DRAFT_569155 [Auriculariopsis ampla]
MDSGASLGTPGTPNSYRTRRRPQDARQHSPPKLTRLILARDACKLLDHMRWLQCRRNKDTAGSYPIKISKDDFISALAGELPVATIILLLKRIAISKSFSRVNGYKINQNQELIAIDVTNLVGSCFNA